MTYEIYQFYPYYLNRLTFSLLTCQHCFKLAHALKSCAQFLTSGGVRKDSNMQNKEKQTAKLVKMTHQPKMHEVSSDGRYSHSHDHQLCNPGGTSLDLTVTEMYLMNISS